MRLLRKILIAISGGFVLLVGIAMIVLPGPAIVVIPAGLAILAVEFAWARHWLNHTKEFIAKRTPIKGTFRETVQHLFSYFSRSKPGIEPKPPFPAATSSFPKQD